MTKFAVLSFPGTNSEAEAARAFRRSGMEAEVLLWNDERLKTQLGLAEFDGYCIAGGFSYEDRGRSGVVAAQEPVMKVVCQEAERGKVVLGICNGAQILVESGLIPGFSNHALGMALAWNEMREKGEVVDTGFSAAWCYLKNTASKNRSAFNHFEELLHIPFAHGEGRFVIPSDLLQHLEENEQILFKYVNEKGELTGRFPDVPNGAMASAAGICNPAGNVMAIMPHPERDPKGNGQLVFDSIKQWIEEKKSAPQSLTLGEGKVAHDVRPLKNFDIEVYVRLIITDNAERTLEEALQRKGMEAALKRFQFFGIRLKAGQKTTSELIESLMKSGELANLNKHQVFIKTAEGMFAYYKEGLMKTDFNPQPFVIAVDHEDMVGESKRNALDLHVANVVDSVCFGVLWQFVETSEETRQKVLDSFVLYNPYSMFLMS